LNGRPFPFPTREEIPVGLQSLLALVMRAQEQQKMYANTPLAQSLWPDAKLQYVTQPAPGLYSGVGLRFSEGRPDARIGVGFGTRF
jgi:hypothetical protein